MKNKVVKVLLLLCITAILTVSITYAAFYSEIKTTNVITIGDVEVELIDIYTRPTNVSPGQTISKIVSAKNTGKSDEYVRIGMEKVWTDLDGNKIAELDTDHIELNFSNKEYWIYGGDGYYYYQKPLKPGETASNLIDSFKLSLDFNPGDLKDIEGKIIVSAQAVQVDNFTPEIVDGEIVGWGDIVIADDDYEGEYNNVEAKDEKSNVYYQEGSNEFITIPGDDLFLNFKGLMPGDDKVQIVNIANKNDNTIHLYMYAAETDASKFTSEEAKEISDNLISASTLEIIAKYKDGTSKVIYTGSVHGKGKSFDMTTKNAIYLGRFEKDDEATLDVKLHIPEEWTKGGVEGKVDWIFTCAKEEEPEVIPSPPKVELPNVKTGDNNMKIALVFIAISAISGAVMITIKKSKV